jgi:transcriptional regulator with GAF, ATPase, and Fis domain
LQSLLSVPLNVGGKYLGAISFNSFNEYRTWQEVIIRRLKQIGEIFANAIARKRSEKKLKNAFKKIKILKERAEGENFFLKQEIEQLHDFEEIVGNSKAINEVLKKVEQVAGTSSTVLILGETGTGKELIARAIHKASKQQENTMINLNCTAIPSTLMESELFGHEKGSFTGAYDMRMGLFEVADGSTIFLDEIGSLAKDLQVKLLRVLQESEVQRVGSTKPIKVDIRVIAASNFDLESEVSKGNFREDLFYRINVFPITVPPLRKRKDDIPLLIWKFIDEFNERMNKNVEKIPKRLLKTMTEYQWPGNIRELRNIVERAMIISSDKILRVDASIFKKKQKLDTTNLNDVNKQHITQILELTNWKVSGKNGAAELLGIKPTTLEARMSKLGIKRPPE